VAGLEDIATLDIENLGSHKLNGREIKNIVKLSCAKAKGLGIALNNDLVEEEIKT